MIDTKTRLEALRPLVGDTPLLSIHCRYRGQDHRLYAKLEVLSLTGSVKDRMALHILAAGHASGELETGTPIVEATSGNTGIAFAALGRALGHPVRIYMPDWMSRERVDLIEGLGAEVIPISKAQGGFLGSIAMARDYAAKTPGVFQPLQFQNPANTEAHRCTTGPEIIDQLASIGLKPTAFVAGVGTGGTVMGVGACLRESAPGATIHPLEPSSSPTLRTGHCVGSHRIQGVSDEFIPEIIDLQSLDSIVDVDDGDAILMAQALSHELGLGVGISSGANLVGALKIAHEQGPKAVVVTVFADSNKKYLSTDLFRKEAPKEGALTPEVELLGFTSIPRQQRRPS